MKVPASIRRIFDDQKAINDRLRTLVDTRITGIRDPRWHYESRVKELESFALKIESGRFQNPSALEDFFACTVVVANAKEIKKAHELISEAFAVKRRKPKQPDRTHKSSNSFPFDDLRLYVTLKKSDSVPATGLEDVLFEVQIKTFLQHAWTIATHDLVYKTDDMNWSKERIAYQIKAMLEHAEVSIQEAESLAECSLLAMEDSETSQIKRSIALLKSNWEKDELPKDVRQLASNVLGLINELPIQIERLEEILRLGKAERNGAHPLNLSPYSAIVQYLLKFEQEKTIGFLAKPVSKNKILIPAEVELPPDVSRNQIRNAVFVSESERPAP